MYRFRYALINTQYHDENQKVIVRLYELESSSHDSSISINANSLDGIRSSMIGLVLGDAVATYAEFRPHQYLIEHSVTELHVEGTCDFQKGQLMHLRKEIK